MKREFNHHCVNKINQCNNYMNNYGSSNSKIYDDCMYKKTLSESTAPLNYQLYNGKYENSSTCVYDKFYSKSELIDIDSELKNITRPLSKCDEYGYKPRLDIMFGSCNMEYPIVQNTLCPVVKTNIKKNYQPIKYEKRNVCQK